MFLLVVEVIYSKFWYNREIVEDYEMVVIGVFNVGKLIFINYVRCLYIIIKKKSLWVGVVVGVIKVLLGKIWVNFNFLVFFMDILGIFIL